MFYDLMILVLMILVLCKKSDGAMACALCCHASSLRFDLGAVQGDSLSFLQWADKMSTKFAWELNTGGPASGWLPD